MKRYLTNWGFHITDDQFKEFYNFLDYDKDGHITYEDFKKSVGSVISPVEFLYFRQDKPLQKILRCRHSNCWEETKGMGKYCFLHKKIVKDKTLSLISSIQRELGKENWKTFINSLRKACDITFTNQISIKKFFSLIEKFGISIKEKDREELIECFHLKDEGNSNEINVQPIFDFGKTKAINKLYKAINLEQKEDEEELSIIQQKLMPISEIDMFKIISLNPNMYELWKDTRKQDRDSNGFLTLSELNTTFQKFYPKLRGKSLFKVFKPFTSIQNKSLVDYKRFKEYVESRISAYSEVENPKKNKEAQLSRNHVLKESQTYQKVALPSPRELKSPSMMRMEQIKDNILRAAENSPLLKSSKNLTKAQTGLRSPRINLKKRSTLEALVSPRRGKIGIQRENSIKRYNKNLISGGQRVMSPDRLSVNTKFSQYSTYSTPFFSKSNDFLKQKLEYEWKNIYRSLNSIDLNSSGYVTKKEFIS